MKGLQALCKYMERRALVAPRSKAFGTAISRMTSISWRPYTFPHSRPILRTRASEPVIQSQVICEWTAAFGEEWKDCETRRSCPANGGAGEVDTVSPPTSHGLPQRVKELWRSVPYMTRRVS